MEIIGKWWSQYLFRIEDLIIEESVANFLIVILQHTFSSKSIFMEEEQRVQNILFLKNICKKTHFPVAQGGVTSSECFVGISNVGSEVGNQSWCSGKL